MNAVELKDKLMNYYIECEHINEMCHGEVYNDEFMNGLYLAVMKLQYWIEHDPEIDDMAEKWGEPYAEII